MFPGRLARRRPGAEVETEMRRAVRSTLNIIASAAADHFGILVLVKRSAHRAGFRLRAVVPNEFLVLFPTEPPTAEGFAERERRQAAAAARLARRWARQDANAVAALFARYDQAGVNAGISWPRTSSAVAEGLASRVGQPADWARRLMSEDARAELVAPFVSRVVRSSRPEEVADLLDGCLRESRWAPAVIPSFLTEPAFPDSFCETAMSLLGGYAAYVQGLTTRGQIPEKTLGRVLAEGPEDAAIAAAIGEWSRAGKGAVRPKVARQWRSAVLRAESDGGHSDYWLGEMLAADPELSHDWLSRRAKAGELMVLFSLDHHLAVRGAVNGLDEAGQSCVLSAVHGSFGVELIAAALVGDSVERYGQFLRDQSNRRLHLAPLARQVDEVWAGFAVRALDAGYSVTECVHAARAGGISFSGPESAAWGAEEAAFGRLAASDDDDVASLGRRGAQVAREAREAAERRERDEAVRGG